MFLYFKKVVKMASSSFSRQLRFALQLVDSHARLTADALLDGNIEFSNSMARTYSLTKKFLDSRIWYDWKCSSYKIFVEKFYECCKKGEV